MRLCICTRSDLAQLTVSPSECLGASAHGLLAKEATRLRRCTRPTSRMVLVRQSTLRGSKSPLLRLLRRCRRPTSRMDLVRCSNRSPGSSSLLDLSPEISVFGKDRVEILALASALPKYHPRLALKSSSRKTDGSSICKNALGLHLNRL